MGDVGWDVGNVGDDVVVGGSLDCYEFDVEWFVFVCGRKLGNKEKGV